MDKKYWENYYKAASSEQEPSLFAQFIFSNYLKPGDSLLELGCGNGRDSNYFAQNGIDVVAVDQCDEEIQELQNKKALENLTFKTGDFTKLNENKKFNKIYSRFTLHSISESDEDSVILWSYNNLLQNGYLSIEARGHKNELYRLGEKVSGEEHAYIYNNHYRRFVDLDTLVSKLKNVGFEVLLSNEQSGFAPYQDTDYTFFRVVALKK